MNKFAGKGRLVRNAVVNGVKNKALSFTVLKAVYVNTLSWPPDVFCPRFRNSTHALISLGSNL